MLIDTWDSLRDNGMYCDNILRDRHLMHSLITEHLVLRDAVLARVRQHVEVLFERPKWFVVGVHYRGTDKCIVSKRPAYAHVMQEASRFAAQHNREPVLPVRYFQDFISHAAEVCSQAANTSHAVVAGVSRSHNHYETPERYASGQNALLDCLLLSNCDLLVKTESNLSNWSSFFNPHMPVLVL